MSTVRFDAELVKRHGGRGPRYTSYPTAPQFREDFGVDDYLRYAAASNAGAEAAPLSLYMHLPFCRALCYYCGCNKVITRNEARAEEYLQTLLREASMHAALYDRSREVQQVHMGGGSPTFYDDDQLQRLLDHLRSVFTFAPPQRLQCSIEVDPRTVGPERIARLAAMGFNRLSFGVQDFDEEVQRAVNREQSRDDTLALIAAARQHGFRSVSVDLIYGLPKQTPQRFQRTLDTVITARPDRISLYSYAHLPQLFKAQALIDERQLPDDETKLMLLELSVAKLCGAGYEYIGMDHFSRKNDELAIAQREGELHRNFQGYSTHAHCDLVSLGASGIGDVAGAFYQNEKNTNAWAARVTAGEFPIVKGLALSQDDRIRASVIQALMCQGRLDPREVERRFGIDFASYFAEELTALSDLAADGLVGADERGIISVSPTGRLLMRPIAMVFDRYLRTSRREQRFSKVI